jgi:predicted ribosomally synthesized peptide with nif11-like leader
MMSDTLSDHDFQAFQARLQNDEALQQQLTAAAESYAQAVVKIAAEAGFSISAEEVQAAQLSQLPSALSDDDVDGLAGGGGVWWMNGSTGDSGSTQPGVAWIFPHP